MNLNVDYAGVMELMRMTRPMIFNETAVESVSEKGLDNFVTQVDVGVQEFLQNRLLDRYPGIQFMGEENKNEIDFTKPCWILDPIDGTTNLIHHYQFSAVSLALYAEGKLVFGAVYNPFLENMFHAVRGEGAYLDGKRIRVTEADTLADSLIAVGTAPYQKEYAKENFRIFENIFLKSQDIRRTGSAELELCYIAAGRHEGFFERILQPWDYAAGLVIVEEAGGTVTDWDGNALDVRTAHPVVASNGRIHEELRRELVRSHEIQVRG